MEDYVTPSQAQAGRSRRRGEALERPILEAAWRELAEAGWPGFSVERVAIRAGAGKASLYRRWPDRLALVRAAFMQQATAGTQRSAPTGDLRLDLIAALSDVVDLLSGPGGEAVRALASASPRQTDPRPWGLFDPPLPTFQAIAAAQAQGKTPCLGERDESLLLHSGPALVIYQFLVTGKPPGADEIARIVDNVLVPLLSS
jgi:AcrR family transcriptional regulator